MSCTGAKKSGCSSFFNKNLPNKYKPFWVIMVCECEYTLQQFLFPKH